MRSPVVRAVVVIAAVTAVAGVIRFHNLGSPQKKVFDEVYYASDGCRFAGVDFRACGLDDDAERSWVHPPLGKYLVGWGVDGFGNRPLGWRVSAAAAGTATVALTGVLAFLLFGSALWAGVASLLLAVEHLHFVQSRIAMLDVFLAMFVVLGFVFLVADRRRSKQTPVVAGGSEEAPPVTVPAEAPELPPPRSSGVRPLRLAAGAAFGLAVAVKWSGILALLGALVLVLAWEVNRRRRADVDRPFLATAGQESAPLLLALVAVPFLVYLATWIPWLAERGLGLNEGFSLGKLFTHHFGEDEMADYHLGLSPFDDEGEPIHPYMSRAWTWLLLLRPVSYFFRGGGTSTEILGIGNPVLFWGGLLVIPYLAVVWRARRDWRAGAILVPVLFQYLPWLGVPRPLFLFYMTPVTPFLALGATYLVRNLARTKGPADRLARPAAVVIVAAAVGVFAFMWPVLVGDTISMDAWQTRMWLSGWI